MVKNLPAKAGEQEMRVQPLSQEDPLEEGTAAHSSVLAWRIPLAEEPGGLQSIIALQRVGHIRSDLVCMQDSILFLNLFGWAGSQFCLAGPLSVHTGFPVVPHRLRSTWAL